MRREIAIALGGLLAAVASASADEPSSGRALSDAQSAELHREICSQAIYQADWHGRKRWICGYPRNYPGRDPKTSCPLAFRSDEQGRYEIYYGRFSAKRPQAIAMYWAQCEPHATNFGGLALFDIAAGGQFKFVRFSPGYVYDKCVVPDAGDGAVQTAYCYGKHMGQGELEASFGPVTFGPDGNAKFDIWYSSDNTDGIAGPSASCATQETEVHDLLDLRVEEKGSAVIVVAAARDPKDIASACARYLNGDFNDAERLIRAGSPFMQDRAFIRPDEGRLLKMLVRFRPPDRTPHVELTSDSP